MLPLCQDMFFGALIPRYHTAGATHGRNFMLEWSNSPHLPPPDTLPLVPLFLWKLSCALVVGPGVGWQNALMTTKSQLSLDHQGWSLQTLPNGGYFSCVSSGMQISLSDIFSKFSGRFQCDLMKVFTSWTLWMGGLGVTSCFSSRYLWGRW